jgi:hypothetical protein
VKIYCSRQQSKYGLDQFIGKGVWVLTDIEFTYNGEITKRQEWVRVLDECTIEDLDFYIVNSIDCNDLRKTPDGIHYKYWGFSLQTDLHDRRILQKDHFKLSQPIEIMTTEELMELIVQ